MASPALTLLRREWAATPASGSSRRALLDVRPVELDGSAEARAPGCGRLARLPATEMLPTMARGQGSRVTQSTAGGSRSGGHGRGGSRTTPGLQLPAKPGKRWPTVNMEVQVKATIG